MNIENSTPATGEPQDAEADRPVSGPPFTRILLGPSLEMALRDSGQRCNRLQSRRSSRPHSEAGGDDER